MDGVALVLAPREVHGYPETLQWRKTVGEILVFLGASSLKPLYGMQVGDG